MATAVAIDRVMHHSVTLEFDVPSYRTDAAQQRGLAEEVNRQNWSTRDTPYVESLSPTTTLTALTGAVETSTAVILTIINRPKPQPIHNLPRAQRRRLNRRDKTPAPKA